MAIPPTPEDAVRAWSAVNTLGLSAHKGKDGRWRARTPAGDTIRAAGDHESAHEAILAGEAILLALPARRRAVRSLDALDSLQDATYFPRPRNVPHPDQEIGGTLRLWDIVKVGGVLSSVVGKLSVLIALEEAEAARLAGTL